MKAVLCMLVLLALTSSAFGKVYYQETFDGEWKSRWVQSKAKSDYGEFKVRERKKKKYPPLRPRIPP